MKWPIRALAITGMLTSCMISRILAGGRQPRHAAFLANVGGHAFQRHDRASAGLFGDDSLLGVGDVHDHAALQHFSETDLQAESFVEVHFVELLRPSPELPQAGNVPACAPALL